MEKAVLIFDLARLSLSSGEATTARMPVDPGPLTYGGQVYEPTSAQVEATLDVSRTSSGYALRMRFPLAMEGPCMRCLESAAIAVEIDAREVDQPGAGDEELRSPYVDGGDLDLGRWVRDAVALALPSRVLCREDCAGLCAVCGAALNDADMADHDHGATPDPRWAKLRKLEQ